MFPHSIIMAVNIGLAKRLQKIRLQELFITTLLQTMPEILRKRKKQNLTTPLGRKLPTPKRWRSGWLGVQEKYNVIEK